MIQAATATMAPDRQVIPVPPGQCVHVDVPEDRYHQLGNWSSTQLRHLPEDPEAFEWKYILRREEFKVTRDMVCGSAFHAWALQGIEPTLVPREYLTKAGSMKPGGWDELASEFPGVPVVKSEECAGIKYAYESCMADPEIRAYLETAGDVEHSLFSCDIETGLPTRVRVDKLCRFRTGIDLLDIKYSGGIDDRWIEKRVTEALQYRQAGMYWEHVETAYETPQRWVFLYVLNEPPYTARLKQLLPCDIELGIRHTHAALRDLRSRLDSGNWKGAGFGHVGITQVSRWMWEKGPTEPTAPQPFPEFAEFQPKE